MSRRRRRRRQDDCCEYEEENKKNLMTSKRLQQTTKNKRARDKRYALPDGCDESLDEVSQLQQKSGCENNKSNVAPKHPQFQTFFDEMVGRIKPSIKNREKYTADARHIGCLLEAAELEQLKRQEGIFRDFGRKPCDAAEYSRATRRNKEPRGTDVQFPGTSSDEKENNDDVADSTKNGNNKVQKRRGEKDEFWCPELPIKHKQTTNSELREDRRLWEIECKDSICSFDSQIDLTGLALTKEEKKSIRENRRNRRVHHAPTEP